MNGNAVMMKPVWVSIGDSGGSRSASRGQLLGAMLADMRRDVGVAAIVYWNGMVFDGENGG